MPFTEVGDELVKCRLALRETAEMKTAFNRPVTGDRTEGFTLDVIGFDGSGTVKADAAAARDAVPLLRDRRPEIYRL